MSNQLLTSPSTIAARLEELPELRPFPTVASRLMVACEDPDCSSAEIAEIIRCDPATALRLLRVSNSSMYGFSGDIRTVEHAIVVLGFRSVRDTVVSLAATELFSQGTEQCDGLKQLWTHSVACATVARLLASHLPQLVPEEAFLAGILHDVGKLVFYDLAPNDYSLLIRQSGGGSVEAELTTFGISHPQVGLRCAEDWGLPAEIIEAIGHHHSPQEAAVAADLVDLISLANSLAKAWELGVGAAEPKPDAVKEALDRTRLPVEAELLEEVQQRAPAEFESAINCIG